MAYNSDRVKRALRDPSYLRVANIIGISNFNSDNDVDQIEDYLKKNGDPYQNQLDAANRRAEEIRNKSIQDLNNLTQGFTDRIGQMNADFSQRFKDQNAEFNQRFRAQSDENRAAFESFAASAEARYNDLSNVLINTTDRFETSMAAAEARFTDAEARYGDLLGTYQESEARYGDLLGTYQETQRLAGNQARAFVPGANPSARTALAGDDRARFQQRRSAAQRDLDSLNVLTGIGQQANPLAGLQIA